MDAHALAATLGDPAGFAPLLGGVFKGGKAKKAHELWAAAEEKGVYDAYELRRATHDGSYYSIVACSTKGPLDLATRDALAARAEAVPLGTIRFECATYGTLSPWRWHPRSYDPTDHTIDALGDDHEGVIVCTLFHGKKDQYPLIVHARKDGKDWIYPVPAARLGDR